MFTFPSPLDFLRAFALSFLAGAATCLAAMTMVALTFSSLKRRFRFTRTA